MNFRKILALTLALVMVLGTMSTVAFAEETVVAKIGTTEYTNFKDAMTDAYATSGDVEVEIYGAVEFLNGMELKNGNYDSISFVGMNDDAKITINQSAGGDYLEAHGKTIAFTDLKLAKANPKWHGNSGHMGNYFSVQGGKATYTNCTFLNGACTSTGSADYIGCNFQNEKEFGLWVYDDALVTVSGGTIDSKKGIKVYSEGETSVTSTLTVENATFTENVTTNAAVCIGYAESVTLTGNVWNNTAPALELDSGSDADCEGVVFEAVDANGNDITSNLKAVDRSNGHAECGVFVTDAEGNTTIYTSATTAAEAAEEGDTVTLLYDVPEDEEVVFAAGVTVDTNNYEAPSVTTAPISLNGASYATLQAALDAVVVGENVITLYADCDEDVIVSQQEGIDIVLDGNDKEYSGKITIHGNNRNKGKETLTIKDFNFITSEADHDFIWNHDGKNGTVRYAHNITIQDCSFTATGDGLYTAVGLRISQAYNINVIDCTATGMHSLMWATSIDNPLTVDGAIVTNSKNGIAFGTTKKAILKNSNITAIDGYAVRADAEVAGYSLVIEECELEANYPVIVRNAKQSDYNLNVGEGSELTATNAEGYDIVVTSGKDDQPFVKPANDINMTIAEDVEANVFSSHAAKIGSTYYTSLDEAIAAATAGDTVTILAGTYDAFTVPTALNNITFVGETDADGNNLVTIRTLEEGLTTNTGGIFVQPETATFKNLNITAGTTAYKGGWMTSSLGNTNGETGVGSNSSLKQLNVENVNFIGAGKHSAIWMNSGSVNFVNSTVDNYAYGVYVYAVNDGQVVNVTGSELSTTNRVVFNQEGSVNGKVNITDSVIDAPMLTVGAGVPATLTGNDIEGVIFYIYGKTDMTENSLVDCTYSTAGAGEITLAENYVNNVNEIVDRTFVRNINFVSYYGTEEDLANKANLVNVEEKANKVYVQYRRVDSEEGTDKYEIVLVGANDVDIHELASADLTFDFEGTLLNGAAMDYAVEAANGVSITKLGDRYLFNYNGVDKYEESGLAIVIGTITIEGYGSYTLKTDESVDTNAVYATKIADNIVEGFTPAAKLVINDEIADDDDMVGKVEGATIAVPVRDLAIDIAFKNAVENQSKAYQDMKVVISGGDLAENIEIELGSDAQEVLDLAGKADAAVEVAYANNAYTVAVTDALTYNRAYTVTVSGAGYRTARYTVTMTDDKELSFWNNVMDNNTAVEEGEFETTKTFLAGDIVKDNNINIYDLSAVVSYFGTDGINTQDVSDYAKYDLNRDGVIDSKDVAYVLVSWGE